jgi:hypothetical protein
MPASVRRHFDRFERFPGRLIPLGDAVCRFNPVFGQGMSVAAQEAVVLERLLDSRRDQAAPLDGLARDYLSRIEDLLEAPWAVALTDFVFPQTRGARPPDLEKKLQYDAALTRLAAEDPETHQTVMEVRHLIRPHSALREPELVRRATALMAAAHDRRGGAKPQPPRRILRRISFAVIGGEGYRLSISSQKRIRFPDGSMAPVSSVPHGVFSRPGRM